VLLPLFPPSFYNFVSTWRAKRSDEKVTGETDEGENYPPVESHVSSFPFPLLVFNRTTGVRRGRMTKRTSEKVDIHVVVESRRDCLVSKNASFLD
jgi:hypothetical protein